MQSITYTKMQSIFCASCTKKITVQSISHVEHPLAKIPGNSNMTKGEHIFGPLNHSKLRSKSLKPF